MFKILYDIVSEEESERKEIIIHTKNIFNVNQYVDVAITGDTEKGFCVYVGEPTVTHFKRGIDLFDRHMVSEKHTGTTHEQYTKALSMMHNLANAINSAYKANKEEFDVSEWLSRNSA
jgi:hypothetical protein